MNIDQINGLLTGLTNLGAAGMVLAAIGWLFYRYGTRLIDTHLDFVAASKEQGERAVKVLEDLGPRQHSHATATGKTNEALRLACDVIEEFSRDHQRERDLGQHLAAIRNALR